MVGTYHHEVLHALHMPELINQPIHSHADAAPAAHPHWVVQVHADELVGACLMVPVTTTTTHQASSSPADGRASAGLTLHRQIVADREGC